MHLMLRLSTESNLHVHPGDDEHTTKVQQQVMRVLRSYPHLLFQYLHTLLGPRKATER